MYFFTFLLKNLLRRPARSMLTVVGLAVAVAAVVSLVGVATGFENSFLEVYTSRGVDLVIQRRRQAEFEQYVAGIADGTAGEAQRRKAGCGWLSRHDSFS